MQNVKAADETKTSCLKICLIWGVEIRNGIQNVIPQSVIDIAFVELG